MIIIDDVLVDDEVADTRFACDLGRCKGACCTLPGGRGAPLDDAEVGEIMAAYPYASRYLSAERAAHIARTGIVEGTAGNYATQCVDNRDCVLVYYDEGVAKCSLERAFLDGATRFRKPVSCHLFPLRAGKGRLRYERILECAPGRSQGEAAGTPLRTFLKDALIRKFGSTWYEQLQKACEEQEPHER